MAYEYYAIDLPGKSLYEKSFNIKIRRITPIEQKYILSLADKQQKTNKDYLDFIKKLVEFDNLDMTFEELYWFDLQYILYRIRFTTYEKFPISLSFTCIEDGCNEKFTQKLDMGNMQILTPEDLPELKNTITLQNLGEVKIRQKILQDDLNIDEFMKAHNIKEDDIQGRLLLLDLCLISNGKTLEEMYSLAEQDTITASDIISVEHWFTNSIWGVKETINTKCPKCGKEASRAYFLRLEDFFSAI